MRQKNRGAFVPDRQQLLQLLGSLVPLRVAGTFHRLLQACFGVGPAAALTQHPCQLNERPEGAGVLLPLNTAPDLQVFTSLSLGLFQPAASQKRQGKAAAFAECDFVLRAHDLLIAIATRAEFLLALRETAKTNIQPSQLTLVQQGLPVVGRENAASGCKVLAIKALSLQPLPFHIEHQGNGSPCVQGRWVILSEDAQLEFQAAASERFGLAPAPLVDNHLCQFVHGRERIRILLSEDTALRLEALSETCLRLLMLASFRQHPRQVVHLLHGAAVLLPMNPEVRLQGLPVMLLG